jgi:hypothetical protein
MLSIVDIKINDKAIVYKLGVVFGNEVGVEDSVTLLMLRFHQQTRRECGK